MWKAIRPCFGFALLCSVVGWQNSSSQLQFYTSEVEKKQQTKQNLLALVFPWRLLPFVYFEFGLVCAVYKLFSVMADFFFF